MEIKFDLKRIDIVKVYAFVVPQTLIGWSPYFLLLLIVLVLNVIKFPQASIVNSFIPAVFYMVLFMIFGTFFSMILHQCFLRKDDGVLGEHIFEIKEEGVLEKTIVNEGIYKWRSIKSIFETEGMIVIYVGGFSFHIISSRGFNSEEEFYKFYITLCEKWENSKK